MKKRHLLALISAIWLNVAFAELPQPLGYVSDYADLLSRQDIDRVTQAVTAIEASTGAEIAVIVQDTLDENITMEEQALAYLSGWKVGKKGQDNGLVLLLVVDKSHQHGQYRFETGLGLEGDLPDGRLGQIGRENLIPYFRQGDYGGGILAAIVNIGEILGADMTASRPAKPKTKGIPALGIIIAIIVFFMIFGGRGRGGHGIRSGVGGSDLLWLMLLGGMGGRHRGGGWGGLGGGGFGGGGGGFGGFGGGGGGAGGGAGGSW